MPPEPRLVPRFAAEPPQEGLPYGRFELRLREALLQAVAQIEDAPPELSPEQIGEPLWFPDRSWHGYTYIPATAPAGGGYEVFGYVRLLVPADGDGGESKRGGEPTALQAHADFTAETAAGHGEWRIDLSEEPVGRWRGEGGADATMTLVWGRPLVGGGALVTAELAGLAVDQCALVGERFTLLAPDDYRGDLLEIKLWDGRGRELARESLYEEE